MVTMCPDRQIISLYFDGELPSPWKEKMETHLEACPECRAAITAYGSFGKQPDDPGEESISAAQERIWKKLFAPALVVSEKTAFSANQQGEVSGVQKTARQRNQRYMRERIWNRSVTMPLPAAAAAAVLIIIAMLAIFGLRDSRPGTQDKMAVIPEYMQVLGNEHGMVPTTNMNSVLQYLSSLDNGDFMVIRLPETKNFVQAGEPALINAADYSRRQLPR